MKFEHTPVLLTEVLDHLDIQPDGIYVDGTLGGGGHASHVLERLSESGRLIGIDQDEDAIAASTERLAQYGARVTIVRSNYEHMDQVLAALGIGKVNGILLDLGVSSYQLDNPERGFTYRTDAPLDMRMDRRNAVTAAQIVNSYPVDALTRILRDYGEEKCAARIAQAIVRQRETEPITTTGQLSRIV
ncbi:MAG: 16S rRNA (cytosine(1402)-N(4))-methyltransferase RsmH, partial [Eubacteriales bacterium]|nr:16S rRNA (cytosine(1402)-N(4))-methyltransferase RsmH [Eubacteriales bacterium]